MASRKGLEKPNDYNSLIIGPIGGQPRALKECELTVTKVRQDDSDLLELIGDPLGANAEEKPTGPPDPDKKKAVSFRGRNGLQKDKSDIDFSIESEATCQPKVGAFSALDKPIRWTRFPTHTASFKADKHNSLRQLVDIIKAEGAADKNSTPWLKLAAFGWKQTQNRSFRSDDNVTAISGIEADYDAGVMTIDEAAAKLEAANLAGLIYTTPSHGRDGMHKWRVLLPLSTEMARDKTKRTALVERVNAVFDGALDQCMFTMSQAYHYGAVRGGPPIETRLVEGRFLDEANELPRRPKLKAPSRLNTGDPELDDMLDLTPGRSATEAELLAAIASGDDYENATIALAGKYARQWSIQGSPEPEEAEKRILAAFDQARPIANGRGELRHWEKRRDEVASKVKRIYQKEARKPDAVQIDPVESDFEEISASDSALEARDSVVARLNRKHAMVSVGGSALVATFEVDGTVSLAAPNRVAPWYANEKVQRNDEKLETSFKRWMESRERRSYPNGVIFDPSDRVRPGALNLWRGWGVKPNPKASCELIKAHIFEVLAAGNQAHADYITGWLAHMVQRPAQKPHVALVFRGGKGAGKDTLAAIMRRIVGKQHVAHIDKPDLLTQRFNAHLAKAILVWVEEAYWAGDKGKQGTLQSLITAEEMTVEPKGVDAYSVNSYCRLLMTTNEVWAVPASHDERRYAVFDVASARIGDRGYFNALYDEIDGEGAAAFFAYLQAYDIKGFQPRDIPGTDALRDQKLNSLSGVERWWFEVLKDGQPSWLPFGDEEWTSGVVVSCGAMRDSYTSHLRGFRYGGDPVSQQQFGQTIRQLCPPMLTKRLRAGNESRQRSYELPNLDTCRAAFSAWLKEEIDWTA